MNFNISYALNFYSLALLMILLVTMIVKKEDFKYSSRLLRWVIVITIAILAVEILSWAFDGIDAGYARVLNYTFNLLFFLMGPIIVGAFSSYADYLNFHDKERIKKRFYYMHLVVAFSVLAIVNIFTDIIFSIDLLNVYSRGSYMNYCFIAVFLQVLYIIILTYSNRAHLEKEVYYSILIFTVIPAIGGILQMIFFGLLVMWAAFGLAVVIAYIYSENVSNSKDYLTKLYTRQIMTEYMERLEEKNSDFTILLFDLDDLKNINDTFGHKQGDRVLIHFSRLLKESFPSCNAMIGRIGGDEFLIAVEKIDENQMKKCLAQLDYLVNNYNQEHTKIRIHYSHGIGIRKKDSGITADQIFIACDKSLYKEKAKHKKALAPKE